MDLERGLDQADLQNRKLRFWYSSNKNASIFLKKENYVEYNLGLIQYFFGISSLHPNYVIIFFAVQMS